MENGLDSSLWHIMSMPSKDIFGESNDEGEMDIYIICEITYPAPVWMQHIGGMPCHMSGSRTSS